MVELKSQFEEEAGIIAVLTASVVFIVGSIVFIGVRAACSKKT